MQDVHLGLIVALLLQPLAHHKPTGLTSSSLLMEEAKNVLNAEPLECHVRMGEASWIVAQHVDIL
jgi:hypothetical protein